MIFTSRNIVSTVNLGCKLDLKKIALHARNAEYNPKVLLFVYFSLELCGQFPSEHSLFWCIEK